jgi:hypothetical protein
MGPAAGNASGCRFLNRRRRTCKVNIGKPDDRIMTMVASRKISKAYHTNAQQSRLMYVVVFPVAVVAQFRQIREAATASAPQNHGVEHRNERLIRGMHFSDAGDFRERAYLNRVIHLSAESKFSDQLNCDPMPTAHVSQVISPIECEELFGSWV